MANITSFVKAMTMMFNNKVVHLNCFVLLIKDVIQILTIGYVHEIEICNLSTHTKMKTVSDIGFFIEESMYEKMTKNLLVCNFDECMLFFKVGSLGNCVSTCMLSR